MAHTDLQPVYVKPGSGGIRRLDGKLGLAAAFDNLIDAANDTAAESAAVSVGEFYHTSCAVNVRLT